MSSQRSSALIVIDRIVTSILTSDRLARFFRRNGIFVAILAFMIIWTWSTTSIAAHNARIETTDTLTEKYEAEYNKKVDDFIAQWEEDHKEAEEPWVKAMNTDEVPFLAKLANKLRSLGLNDQQIETYLWSVPARVDNGQYPSTIKAVLEQAKQYDLYDPSIKATDADEAIARRILTMWHNDKYPNGLTVDHVYAVWTYNDCYLRNSYETDSKTNYWRLSQ